MGSRHAPVPGAALAALAALAVTIDAPGSAVAAALEAAGTAVRATRALTLPAALATLAACEFDLLLVEVGGTDLAATEVVRTLKDRAGTAVLLVVHDGPVPSDRLAEVADVVLRRHELGGGWLRPVRALLENTRLKAALAEAESAAARLLGIVDSVGDAVFSVDADGTVSSWNRGAEQIYGWRADEIVGQDVGVLHAPGSDESHRLLAVVRDGEQVRGLETVRRTRDGRLAEVTVDVTGRRGADGTVVGMVVVARDGTDRHTLEAELVRRTMEDALTGLPNRSDLTYRLAQALADGRRRDDPVAVLAVDLDRFRVVDDLHGRAFGDRVLVEVAERLRRLVASTDVVARSGGDEFVVVSPGSDVPAAEALAQRIIEVLGAPFELAERAVRIGASVGIAVSPPLDGGAASMLDHADAALHEAKSRGRARSQVFDQIFARRTGEQHKLAVDLREALDRDRLDVLYQPVHDLATDRVVGVEALARWNHPLGGVVPPGTFVPLAEAHGFVGDLDRWVLERACREVAAAIAEGLLPADARVAVNLSARSLDERDLVVTVDRTLRRTGLPAAALVLEVTETAVLTNRDAARASIEGLRNIGVGIHLDDFGTGYSSLSFLRDLPVTGVKIDRSFVRDATGRPEDLAITEAVVRLTRGLGLDTVAEGIETVEQRDLLRELGCEHAQGFWWSPAVPLAELARRTATSRAVPVVGRDARRTATVAAIAAVAAPAVPAGPASAGSTALATPVAPTAPTPLGRLAAAPTPRRRAFGRRTVEPPAAVARTACCLRGGLEDGQAWLVVADTGRRASIARALGPVHAQATARGLLVELDSFDTLRAVTGPDGRLDPVRFQQVVGSVLRRLGSAATQLGVHAELGQVNRPRRSVRVATDLRHRLQAVSDLVLEHVEDAGRCERHSAGPGLPMPGLAAEGSTAS